MTEPTSWCKWDLAHLRNHAGVRFHVVDAGMGKPRGNMVLHTVGGHRIFRGDECLLTRPDICRGDWVRSSSNYLPAARLLRVCSVYPDGAVEFDCEYYKIDATVSQPSVTSSHVSKWVPVLAPEAIHLTLAQNHATLLEEVKRLKRLIGEKNKEISAVAERYSNRVKSLEAELEVLKKTEGRREAARDGAYKAMCELEKKVRDLECAHKGALGQRDKERDAKWEAQEHLRRLKEAYALKCKENEMLLALYEAKTERAKKPEIVM